MHGFISCAFPVSEKILERNTQQFRKFLYSGWLEDEEGEAIGRLNRKLEAITGLSTVRANSEALQVNIDIKSQCFQSI